MSSTQGRPDANGLDLNATALEMLKAGAFPNHWAYLPVSGKETYVKGWTKGLLDRQRCVEAYKANRAYNGIGVITGEVSQGLIALDVDGWDADSRYREVSGEEYEPYGKESTMSWSSGIPGRRQILYQVPRAVVPELRHVKKIILRMDGSWYLGDGDVNRKSADGEKGEKEYEEVVLRFNHCQSVLPGSKHPETKSRYRWLNYNEGQVAPAPGWILNVLRGHRKPVQWLSEKDQALLEQEFGSTALPPTQIRGWFFKEDVQRLLRPRLAELVFNHPVFQDYGWKERNGENPQRMSGCPWHGGRSGTSFQYSTESGCWDCKACGVGGDVIDFRHKIETNNLHAGRPTGPDLERYVAEIAGALGFNYPEDAQAQVMKEAPLRTMSSVEFYEELGRIYDSERNPAVRMDRMAQLAAETGRRMGGKDCEAALGEYRYKKAADQQNRRADWFDNVESQEFIIPNMLVRPGQVVLHSAGGVGKTSACLGLAKAIGTGRPMKVRGIEVNVVQGPVLWIQSDQTLAKLKRDLEDNDIDPVRKDHWFHLRRGFQINHMQEFADWVREIKPVLVVVDSIGSCSSRMQVSEIEKAFATPLYWYNEANGSPAEDGFPACAIVWIHHDNANGEIRGNRYLVNAIDEQWHLRKLKDEERDALRERGENPAAVRMIQIKKSRAGREGDLLKVTRDQNFAYSLEDYTPTLRREDNGLGDPDPFTLVLDVVKQACKDQEAEERPRVGVTREEAWREVVERLQGLHGERARMPSSKTVGRWLDRWVEDGMLTTGKGVTHQKGRPSVTYLLPSRALPSKCVSFSENVPEFFQRKGSFSDKPQQCPKIPEAAEPEAEAAAFSDNAPDVQKSNPVPEGDLGDLLIKDIHTDTTREALDELEGAGASPEAGVDVVLPSGDQDGTGQPGGATEDGWLPEAPESGENYGAGFGF